jgi:hypothetical protein
MIDENSIGERTQLVNLRRLEIDDIIDQEEETETLRVESDEMKLERQVPHFLKRDWLMRGSDSLGHSIKRNIAFTQLKDFLSGKRIDLSQNEGKIRPLRQDLE